MKTKIALFFLTLLIALTAIHVLVIKGSNTLFDNKLLKPTLANYVDNVNFEEVAYVERFRGYLGSIKYLEEGNIEFLTLNSERDVLDGSETVPFGNFSEKTKYILLEVDESGSATEIEATRNAFFERLKIGSYVEVYLKHEFNPTRSLYIDLIRFIDETNK